MVACAACGHENPEGQKFCGDCGSTLAGPAPAREVRKTVTVVFCDVTGSTALGERVDPETLRRTMGRYFDEMRAILERHGGTVEKFIGDAVMAVFGIPQVHEDDALRAVRAAAEMRDAMSGLELDARIGVNTGEVVTGDGETLVTGDAVNVAARLEQAAAPGEVLIGAGTLGLVRAAVITEAIEPLELKGKSEPVEAHRLVAVDPDAPGFARRLDTPLVGRERELDLLRQAFARAVSESACHLVTLLGPAGVGKSRLVSEFLGEIDARVVTARCLHYGEGITFWPVVAVLKQLGEEAEAALDRLTGESSSVQETFWTVRKLLEHVASERPLIVVFDDIHWGETIFLDLIDHVADLSREAPILLLCVARPELLDDRPGWGGGKLNATTALLEPLSAEECGRLIDSLDGVMEATLRKRVLEAAEGNPLFVEEMLALAGEGGDVVVPPTIQALLAARLDRLGDGERAVIERGSVEGKVFHRGSVRELSAEGQRPDVETHLVGLVRKELIRPEPPTFAGEDAFRFRHLLIRDAAYDSLSKETRAELHERYAGWLEERHRELVEHDELVGYHLEQAHRYRAELGEPAESLRDLGTRAAARLAAAGRRAGARGDTPGSINLLGRACDLLDPADPQRLELELQLGHELLEAGEFDRARALALGAIEMATQAGADDLALKGRLLHEHVRAMIDPSATSDELRAVAEEAIARFHDDTSLAGAWRTLAHVHLMASRSEEMEAALQRAAHHARASGDRRAEVDALMWLARTAWFGPLPASAGRRRCEELLATAGLERGLESVARQVLGLLTAMTRDFTRARTLLEEAHATQLDLGMTIAAAAGTAMMAGCAELLANDADAAERRFREGYDTLRQMGETGYLSTMAAYLAEALFRQGRYDEAELETRVSEEASSPDDAVSQAAWRGVRAKLLARRGELDAGERLAREAVVWADATDSYEYRATARCDLAEVLRLAGRSDEPRALFEVALELYEQKENEAAADQIRRLLAEL